MKVQVDRGSLVQVLQRVQSITEKKTTMPILSNALIRADDEQVLEFSATDLELSFRTRMGAQIAGSGSRSVSARKLLEIVRELPQDLVNLEMLSNGRISIRAGRSHFELASTAAEDFPFMNFHEEEVEFVACNAAVFRACLEKTFYAIPADDDPFSIAGLYCHPLETGYLCFAASDGHRLACSQMPGETLQALKLENGIIIPRKGVQEILRILEKESDIFLGVDENCLILKTMDSVLTVRLLEAEFPEYRLIIPEERPFTLHVEKEIFLAALKRMAVLSNQKWRHVRLVISSGVLELEAGDPELGKASDVLDVEYEGDDFTVAFNIRYVLDAVQAVQSPKVRFEWVDQYHGGVFLGSDDPGYLALIMPMVV
jgi:DNA polymerase-3 subunit beta